MDKYAQAALEATKICNQNPDIAPRVAWDQATTHLFGASTAGQIKGCLCDAFLGLCEEGFVKGIPKGIYCRSILNKQYALLALNHLRKNPELAKDTIRLWMMVLQGDSKVHNSQMDVVVALWNSKLIF